MDYLASLDADDWFAIAVGLLGMFAVAVGHFLGAHSASEHEYQSTYSDAERVRRDG